MSTTKIRQTRVYEKVADDIKTLINAGSLKPGDPLPPERRMMEDYGVSRSSLREAFRVLEMMGLIESIPGKGRFVRKPRAEDANTNHKEGSSVQLEEEAIMELLEARLAIEPTICSIAAQRATGSDITRLRRILANTEKDLEDPAARAVHDFEFHYAIAEAAHNFVFCNIIKINFDLLMSIHDRVYRVLTDKGAFMNEHQSIYDAIAAHDPESAKKLHKEHIKRIYLTLNEAVAKGVFAGLLEG